jgi:TRAP-type C4-dicarboxylate transport system permease small subunit
MTTRSKQRAQVYAALLALVMLGLAVTCAQVGTKAWQQTGPANAWLSFVAASLLALGAVALLINAVRSVRASLKNMTRRASRTTSGTPDGEVNPRR